MKKILVLLLSILILTSCVSMSSSEKRAYKEIQKYKLDKDAEKEKSIAAAGVLALLPGGGNFYLEQYGAGILNLLTWPFSVAWSFPQVLIDTSTINKQSIVDFYKYDKDGQLLLEAAREGKYKGGLSSVSEEDILIGKRKEEKEAKNNSSEKVIINNNFNNYNKPTE